MEPKSNKKLGLGLLGVVVVVALVGFLLNKNINADKNEKLPTETPVADNTNQIVATTSANKETTNSTNKVVSTEVDVKNKVSTSVYKDGTYTAIGSYMSPGGLDKLGVTVTLKNDVVVETSVEQMAGDPRSASYEKMFADNYQALVVGQKISDLNLTKVSRSSLTPKGFNDAIAKIKSQAKA